MRPTCFLLILSIYQFAQAFNLRHDVRLQDGTDADVDADTDSDLEIDLFNQNEPIIFTYDLVEWDRFELILTPIRIASMDPISIMNTGDVSLYDINNCTKQIGVVTFEHFVHLRKDIKYNNLMTTFHFTDPRFGDHPSYGYSVLKYTTGSTLSMTATSADIQFVPSQDEYLSIAGDGFFHLEAGWGRHIKVAAVSPSKREVTIYPKRHDRF